jgi:hypothetical protein
MSERTDDLQELDASLSQLKRRVRRYVLLEGLAIVVAVLGVGFWISFGADELHFSMRKLELPRWLRIGFTVLLVGTVAMVFLTWVIGRLWHSFGRKLLALVVERRFPQLGDRLITAIELQGSPQTASSPLATAMWRRTAGEAAETIRRVDLTQVFDPRPLRRAVTIAGVLLASVIAIGAANAAGVERWFHAFVLGKDDYWDPYRRSAMSIHVVAQPGDRVRKFDADGIYKHPRGADLTIEAESAEGKPAPDKAVLDFQSFGYGGSSRGSTPMTRRDERVFRQTLTRVVDRHHLWVTAGDYVNRRPLRVLIVEPPKVDRLTLHCDYPSYTGLDSIEDKPVPVQSLQASLPMETAFTVEGQSNKPLVSVLIRSEMFELRFSAPASGGASDVDGRPRITIRESSAAAPRTVSLAASEPWIAADRRSFRVPMRVSANGTEKLLALAEGGAGPLPLPPVAPLQVYLEDEDGIFSTEPTSVTISGTPDLDPVVDVRLTGVSNVVTRMAEIPIRGRITDDYGVAKAEFGYEVLPDPSDAAANEAAPPANSEKKTSPLGVPPRGQKEFDLADAPAGVERFSLTPLELKDGQRLQLAIHAEDADDQNGPHRAHGEVFNFRIVPGEELLARLYEKEVNLRQRFEQIMLETKRLRDDLAQHRERTGEWIAARKAAGDKTATDEKVQTLFNAIDACARRSLHQVRTNSTESRAIEGAFGEIRAEMVNNRVDTPSLLERIDLGVVAPLKTINESDYPDIDGQLGLFALAMERGSDPSSAIDSSREAVDRMLARMEQVLSEMRRRGNINEIIQQLQSIIERQQKLKDETEQRKLDELFEGIGTQ